MSQSNSPELHVGSNVYTIDGEKIGRLRFLMVDPETASVSHIVLEKSSYVHNDVMVPTDRVGQVLNRGIYLTANLGEIIDMEEFPESAYTGRNATAAERASERPDDNKGNRGERQDRGDRDNRDRGDRPDRNNSLNNGNRRNKRYRRHRD